VTPKDQTRNPNTLSAQYLENGWRETDPFQRTTNRKWPMEYEMITSSMTSSDPG